jgi:hypothetical protein
VYLTVNKEVIDLPLYFGIVDRKTYKIIDKKKMEIKTIQYLK